MKFENLNQAKETIEKLVNDLKEASDKPYTIIDVTNLEEAEQYASDLTNLIAQAKQEARELDEGFIGLQKSLTNITSEFEKSNTHLRDANKAYRSIKSVVNQLADEQRGFSELSYKELMNLKAKNKIAQAQARANAEALAQEKGIKNIKEINLDLAEELTDEERALLKAYQGGFQEFQQVNKALDERIKKSNIISDTIKKQKDSITQFMLNPINAVVTSFTFLFKKVMEADKAIGKMGKDLNIGHDAAVQLDERFQNFVHSSQDGYITQARMTEAMTEMNNEMGTTLNLSDQQLTTMSKLSRFSNISFKDQAKMLKTSKALGETYEGYVKSMMGTIKAQKFENNLALNAKKIMLDVNNASDRTKISISGGSEGLAKAAVEAAKLGTNLDGVAGIANQLLDFEQSIEAELSAELVTGKQLSLERARQAALNNDFATVASEINNQLDSAAEFGEMNRIQQEAMAKAVGMTADQLGAMLIEQEAIKAVGGDLNDKEKAAYEMAKEKYGAEKAAQMLKDDQLDKLMKEKDLADKKAAAEERFQAALAGLATAFIPFFEMLFDVANVVIPMIVLGLEPVRLLIQAIQWSFQQVYDLITESAVAIGTFFTTLGLIYALKNKQLILDKGSMALDRIKEAWNKRQLIQENLLTSIKKGNLFKTIGEAAMTAFKSVASIPFVGPVLGAVAAASAVALGMKYMSGNDIFSPGGSGGGYGNRTLFGPEGAIQLNNKDTVIAGTNLFGDDTVSEPGKATEMKGKGEIQVQGGNSNMSDVITAINSLANRPISVEIDGKEVIKATTEQNPKEAGNAVGVNNYQIQ